MDEASSKTSSQELVVLESQKSLEQTESASKSQKPRTRKVLKPSVIKLICQIPELNQNTGKNTGKIAAEVHYTNSLFGQSPIPCTKSFCKSCILAPPQVMSKRPRSSDGDAEHMAKRVCTDCLALNKESTVNLLLTASEIHQFSGRVRHVFCTEFNGQLYKLMDEPEEFHNVGSVLDHVRERRGRKTRVAANRNAVRKPAGKKTLGQKTAGKKIVGKKTAGKRKH